MTIRAIEDPGGALAALPECLLISFSHDRNSEEFGLATEFPKSPGSDRDFAAFLFSGVRKYARSLGNVPALRVFEQSYSVREGAGAFVVQGIRVTTRGPDISWGTNLYHDLHTGEVFDFFDPFNGVL